jgi:hypothetical protein
LNDILGLSSPLRRFYHQIISISIHPNLSIYSYFRFTCLPQGHNRRLHISIYRASNSIQCKHISNKTTDNPHRLEGCLININSQSKCVLTIHQAFQFCNLHKRGSDRLTHIFFAQNKHLYVCEILKTQFRHTKNTQSINSVRCVVSNSIYGYVRQRKSNKPFTYFSTNAC